MNANISANAPFTIYRIPRTRKQVLHGRSQVLVVTILQYHTVAHFEVYIKYSVYTTAINSSTYLVKIC